jgi:uncharacterized protein (TIGR01319 family)
VPRKASPNSSLLAGKDRALLVDFGSTYTKARLIDLASGVILASTESPSTIATDVMRGLLDALHKMPEEVTSRGFDDCVKLACSSAAGGLKIVAIGLVRELTAEAAVRSSLGAGGRVVATFAGGLTGDDLRQMQTLAPDMIVLAGGTDGGNRVCIEDNAVRLAASALAVPIVVAGNRNAKDAVATILRAAGKSVIESDNVLPEINRIDITACAEAIRQAFMTHIVKAKGLDGVEAFVGDLVMPTPHAVLKACQLIAAGTQIEPGFGDLMCVDIGGATTDVYSMADGQPLEKNVVQRGLPEAYAKRTVEGDLGLRLNAPTIVELVGGNRIRELMEVDTFEPEDAALLQSTQTEMLPTTDPMRQFDVALAKAATRAAMRRHCGRIDITYGPLGKVYLQSGKDLRNVGMVIGTGGIFRVSSDSVTEGILASGLYDKSAPEHLAPEAPRCFVDRKYVLYAVGLLATVAPDAAMRLARVSLADASSSSPTRS